MQYTFLYVDYIYIRWRIWNQPFEYSHELRGKGSHDLWLGCSNPNFDYTFKSSHLWLQNYQVLKAFASLWIYLQYEQVNFDSIGVDKIISWENQWHFEYDFRHVLINSHSSFHLDNHRQDNNLLVGRARTKTWER